MAKPRTPIGTFGAISLSSTASGSMRARTRYRDWDGKLRVVQATGHCRRAAEHQLKIRMALNTRQTYESSMRRLVMPVFAELSLREIGVTRCDALLKPQASGP